MCVVRVTKLSHCYLMTLFFYAKFLSMWILFYDFNNHSVLVFCLLHLLNEGNFATVLTSSSPQIIFNEGRPVESESVSPLCLIKSVMRARVEYWEGEERGQYHKKWQLSLKVVSYRTFLILHCFCFCFCFFVLRNYLWIKMEILFYKKLTPFGDKNSRFLPFG